MKKLALIAAMVAAATFGSSANATIFNATNVPVEICDLCAVQSTLTVTTHFNIGDLNVNIDNLMHTYDGDLILTIGGPAGQLVALSNRRGRGGANFISTIFDDEALTAISAASAPFTGSFRPEKLLSIFDGTDAFGTWTLFISDNAGADVGSLNAWGLNIAAQAADVPEPATIAMLGLGLLALAAARRKSVK